MHGNPTSSAGGRTMHRLMLLPLMGALAACTVASGIEGSSTQSVRSTGLWQIRDVPVRLTNSQVTAAILRTYDVKQHSRNKLNAAQLYLACHGDAPAIMIAFVGTVSTRGKTDLAYTVDRGSPQSIKVEASDDRESLVISDKDTATGFIRQIEHSSTLYIVTSSPWAGISEAEFTTTGADAAIAAALGNCYSRRGTTRGEWHNHLDTRSGAAFQKK